MKGLLDYYDVCITNRCTYINVYGLSKHYILVDPFPVQPIELQYIYTASISIFMINVFIFYFSSKN